MRYSAARQRFKTVRADEFIGTGSFIWPGLPINVRNKGAKGDGVADDASAIQEAIDAAFAAGGGIVFFPEGTYKVVGSTGTVTLPYDDGTVSAGYGASLSAESQTTMPYSLNLPTGVHLVGEGRNSTKLEGDWIYGTSAVDTTQKIGIKMGTTFSSITAEVAITGIGFYDFFIPVLALGAVASSAFKELMFRDCAFAPIIQTSERNEYDDIRIYDTPAGIVHGGFWTFRNNTYSAASLPSIYHHGWTDKTYTRRIDYINTRNHTATEDSIDAFFDTYFFKTTNSTTGTGYTSAPTVSVTTSTGSGFAGTASVDVHTGKVTGVVVTNGGSSYDAGDTVAFSGGGGSGAAATLHVSGGVVTAISISRASGVIAGDSQSGLINTAMFRGVCGAAITYHARYGRPNFSNSNRDLFAYGAQRYVFNGGRPYLTKNESFYCERIGFYDKTNIDTDHVMGEDYNDPYLSTQRIPAVIYGESGFGNVHEAIYVDPVAAETIISTGGGFDNWSQMFSTTTLVTTPQPFSAVRFGNINVTSTTTLDWYEEGTSQLTVAGTTSAGSGSYTQRTLRWTRIGNRVFYMGGITYTGHTGTGSIRVDGFPYSANTSGIGAQPGSIYSISGVAISSGERGVYVQTTSAQIRQIDDTGAGTGAPIAAAQSFLISGQYEVA